MPEIQYKIQVKKSMRVVPLIGRNISWPMDENALLFDAMDSCENPFLSNEGSATFKKNFPIRQLISQNGQNSMK